MGKLKFNSETPLYTSDERAWRLEETATALDALYEKNKPIVIFVHGRGIEPNKSLRGAKFAEGLAVHKIERGYDVSALMFNWNSAFPWPLFLDRTEALEGAKTAQPEFAKFLGRLEEYFAIHTAHKRPMLLVHSMGSIVLQHTVRASQWRAKRLFSSVVLSQPDADDVGHSTWLTELGNVENVYVTLNRDDQVLERSKDDRPDGAHALGLGTNQPLAANAKYIDLTNMGALGKKDDDHEVFGKGAMNGQLYVCKFFTEAIHGDAITLDTSSSVESVTRSVVFKLKSKHEPDAPCLAKPDLSDFKSQHLRDEYY